jgi:hypothetical protein
MKRERRGKGGGRGRGEERSEKFSPSLSTSVIFSSVEYLTHRGKKHVLLVM